ncbi:MAG: aldehyde dehydrogenase (NADP(+)) [Bacteroidota bacterium]
MDGRNILGYKYSALAEKVMQSLSPTTQDILEGQFHMASPEEVDEAMQLAQNAFQSYKQTSGEQRAAFFNAIADEIEFLGDGLIQRAMLESGLPEGRLKGERSRTVNQLRLFAKYVTEGSWVEASIDLAQPDRRPFPKADIRKMLVSIGPVVVFTASNFPLAFSTAGGDTASALAAGNPVIIKAHEAHLGTNALVAVAISRAAKNTGMPDGVFSSLNGTGPELGQSLVKHPLCQAVAFTGSHRAGKALFDSAAQRAIPIPVFAEMGSINPVFLLRQKLEQEAAALAKQYAASVTLVVGQFCTNPGLIIGLEGPALTQFIHSLSDEIGQIAPAVMLNQNVCNNYARSKEQSLAENGVQLEGQSQTKAQGNQGRPTVASVKASDFLQNAHLQEEVFGPFTLVVRCTSAEELMEVAQSLQGQLTATLMGTSEELVQQKHLIRILQDRVGRLLFNGVPTGVEVCHSMHHGGPYPATTDGRFTSVGTDAIKRFARPVVFQNCLPDLLPPALQDGNPLQIWRKIDGRMGQR